MLQWMKLSTETSAVWAAAPSPTSLTSTTSTTGSTNPVTLPYRSVEALSSYTASSGDDRSASSTVRFLDKNKPTVTFAQSASNWSSSAWKLISSLWRVCGLVSSGYQITVSYLSQELLHRQTKDFFSFSWPNWKNCRIQQKGCNWTVKAVL